MHWLEKNNIGAPTMSGDIDYNPDLKKVYLYELHTPAYFGRTAKVFINPEHSNEIFTTGLN
jgi:hypothetical protein